MIEPCVYKVNPTNYKLLCDPNENYIVLCSYICHKPWFLEESTPTSASSSSKLPCNFSSMSSNSGPGAHWTSEKHLEDGSKSWSIYMIWFTCVYCFILLYDNYKIYIYIYIYMYIYMYICICIYIYICIYDYICMRTSSHICMYDLEWLCM